MNDLTDVICLIESDEAPGHVTDRLKNREHDRHRFLPIRVDGKFLFAGHEKFWVRGVTYGTFAPDQGGVQFPPEHSVRADFRAMRDAGMNTVRIYTPPPRWLLDIAEVFELRVIVGLAWEQHVAFLDDPMRVQQILRNVRATVKALAGHSAVLCYAVGNEIPAPVVRWHGKRRIERFIQKLCTAVKSADEAALTTYVNYPTTEFLELPFLDFVSFNVYLELRERFASYLSRLQNLAGERPLVLAELGLDSRQNGESAQAHSIGWQIAAGFEGGCAGVVVFAWTDEWFRGGQQIIDWDFGITTRERRAKEALRAVSARFASVPFQLDLHWPQISVVVCSYNGALTIDETLARLGNLDYPDFEIIVVDDGSADQTSAIASKHSVRLFRTENNGLSAARNVGLNAARGSIVAYIDDDAYPDTHWLRYLASAFLKSDHAGIGGPNIPPPGDGLISDCVSNAPGGPAHVLLTDDIAEHIPGCNMAYRREHLLAIGGFDPRFKIAGDDVDLCWRLQERDLTIGFAPAAVVWHHRRSSITAYLKQQHGYARAEAMLAHKWPAKYNGVGHAIWHGRLYGRGGTPNLLERSRIYQGIWGTALFQSLYQSSPGTLSLVPLMPEWYALLLLCTLLAVLGLSWPPLLLSVPLLVAGASLTLLQAGRAAQKAIFNHALPRTRSRASVRLLVACLHLVQPAARLFGRIQYGIGPWRVRLTASTLPPLVISFWSTRWEALEIRIEELQVILKDSGAAVISGGAFDKWDLSIRGGLFGSVKTLAMIEEHAEGHQLFRIRAWPKIPAAALASLVLLVSAGSLAALDHALTAAAVSWLMAIGLGWLAFADWVAGSNKLKAALDEYSDRRKSCLILLAKMAQRTPLSKKNLLGSPEVKRRLQDAI